MWRVRLNDNPVFAGPALRDGGASLAQLRGLFHPSGSQRGPGGQQQLSCDVQPPVDAAHHCVCDVSDVFSSPGGHFQREPAARRLGLGHVVQPADGRAEGERTRLSSSLS